MTSFDKIPQTQADAPFPAGDISRSIAADDWIAKMENLKWNKFLKYIGKTYVPTTDTYTVQKNHQMAEELTIHWDLQQGSGRNYVKTGFMAARSMINHSEMLPDIDSSIVLELIHLKNEAQARQFGRAAWKGMEQSYPVLFDYHNQIFHHTDKELSLMENDRADLYIAGLTVPYMMTVMTALTKQVSDSQFTSLSREDVNIQSPEFSKLFTNKTPLAKNNRKNLGRRAVE